MLHSTASDLYEECCALYGVRPNRDVAQQLARPNFLTIRELDASRTFLGELGVRALLEFVGSHAGIRRLVLTKNGVDAACVEHLCSVLRESPSLSSVDLSQNPMSTPSVRLLWETVRAVPHLQEVKIDNCGVSEDWVNRLGRCCKANSELQHLGFYPYGPERSLRSWETVFVLLLGPEPLVQAYCRDALPYVGSFLSRLRLRIAPLTIEKTDTHDVVMSKVWRCKSSYNYALSWCVVLIDEATQWTDPDISALTAVLRQEEPVVPPLRNKFGVLRDPIHRCAKHLFVYVLLFLYEDELNGGGRVSTVQSGVWLAAMGITVSDGVQVPPAVALPSERSWRIRCPTDICTALYSVFSERPRSMTFLEEDKESAERVWETIEREKSIGSLHPRCNDIVHYMERSAGQLSVPLILYGAGDLGKPQIVSWVAANYATVESLRVVPYHVSHEARSLVVLLFHLLRVFSRKPRRVYRSVEELSLDVRGAISAYDGQMVLLLVSSIDHLDGCGGRESSVLEWLPASLPPSVRVIVSLNTESPLLTALRKRMPQPYELLITSLPKQVRAELFLQELLRRGVSGASSAAAQPTRSGSSALRFEPTKSLESAFLLKDGSESVHFGMYTAALLQRMPEDLLEWDTAFLMAEEVPDTLDEIITLLLRRYEALSDTLTVQYLTMSLVASPLPISEVTYICEELGPCARHKTLPVILMMSDDGLLTVTSDSVVHLSGSDVRRVVLKLYADMQDTLSVLVETHLFRLVKTRSPDMSFCFRHLAPIMIANGSLVAAYELVLSPIYMDALLSRDPENGNYAVDLVFSLLSTRQFLLELDVGASSSMKANIDGLVRGALQSALEALQSYDGCFFQAALLASDVSPYQVRAMKATEVPYTVLVPLNRGDEDDATHSLECKHLPLYCHLWGEYLVVTTTQEVIVYSAANFENEIARSFLPFEANQNLCGSLVAAGTRVVVVGNGQLLLWDFASQSFTMFEDTTTSLNENALDSFGLSLLVRHPSKEQFSIIDVSKKKVVMELPTFEAPVREALYCGSGILARALYDLFLLREEEEAVMKLAHSGAIRGVSFCSDSRLIASCVRESIWIWSGAGELLHLIDAGLTPVEDLCFNASGELLLSWQSEGVKLWRSLSGDCAGAVEPCFDERASFICFTEDGSNILGRCGAHIYLWDVHTRQPAGCLRPAPATSRLCRSEIKSSLGQPPRRR
ncbi:WD40 repeat-containing protein [Trypanosoma conorhini]|uniref:WD40 repeat-containing protein n=1 Tax=Trypanosoma conorhini TaxID=83891 RepID=A0A3R7KZD4_9TRYP|nr:WD40 repeat-containing protein [Trypanosoma conorhini]RNF18068.1 WD40 repeat-containing protein [Trypanosoma conorhini]